MTEQTREKLWHVSEKLVYTALGATLAMGLAWGGLVVRVSRLETDVNLCMSRGARNDTRIAVIEARVERLDRQ